MARKFVDTEATGLEKDPYQMLWDGVPAQEGAYFVISSTEEGDRFGDRQGEVFQLLRLERDPKVAAVLQIRVNGTINRPCKVLSGGDRPNDIEAAEFVRRQLLGVEEFPQSGILDEISAAMLPVGILAGYGIGEVLWQEREGWIEIREIRARSPERFVFWRNPDGEREEIATHWGFDVRMRTLENPWKGTSLPKNKILVYTFGSRTHNPFGLGLGSRIWWSVKLKRDLLYDWMRYCGTFAQPTIVGKIDPETDNGRLHPEEYEQQQQDLFRFLKSIRNGTIGVLPEGASVSFLEAMRGGGESTYKTLYDAFNQEISEIVLGNLNHGNNQGLSGAPAKADEEIRLEVAKADADTFHSQTVNGQIVRWLVDLNRHKLGDAAYPQIWRDFSVEENKNDAMERLEKLYNMGFRLSLDAVRRQFGEDYEDVQGASASPMSPSFSESEAKAAELDAWIVAGSKLVTPLYSQRIRQLQKLLDKSESLEQFRDSIFSLQTPPSIAIDFLDDALVAARLAGEWEAGRDTAGAEFADADSPYSMRFDEAISWLEGKLQLPTSARQRISAEWAAHAFWIASIADAQLLAEMFDAVRDAIANGEGLTEFQERFAEIADRYGWTPKEGIAPRAKLVFDANLRTAFAAGQFAQYTKPHILQAFPEWEWRHRDSLHPRLHHLAMDGKRFAASANPPFWLPSGYGCRCRMIPRRPSGESLLDVEMVQHPKGIKGELSPSVVINGKREFLADPGWGAPPSVANRQQVINSMLAKLPPDLAANINYPG